ncbi:Thiosulfate sulfurtransferase rdl2, mitochondrial [Talaromyces marneffei ATCC 18224]|uniref:Rhodanese domain protein n=2 Tax=Talaromyces marneffei TaxID=37727 RepID=B6QKS5_TALMQ|nr:uncharacterized protein EYB26_008187 [Talaromyces marneffei]EEA21702.1 Rhodanese domain protein [Talaromyces marneffei ATCC 18224]KAE8550817.1 hypothetical protein EYB25_007047 [Talaromyces marneffei]QGA20483.1 hypothetical protein EYB26_008187 [Talaromyces marneffei]
MSGSLAGAVARRSANTVFRASSCARSSLITGSRTIRIASQGSRSSSTARCQLSKASYASMQRSQIGVNQQQRRKYSSEDAPVFKQIEFDDINSKTSHSPSNTILIDVREPAELAATGIIPGAVSIPLASQPDAYFLPAEEFKTRFGFAKPVVEATAGAGAEGEKKEIIFYCKAGVRAQAAAQLAVQAGYDPDTLGVYRGSWLDWSDRGGKVERWEGNE